VIDHSFYAVAVAAVSGVRRGRFTFGVHATRCRIYYAPHVCTDVDRRSDRVVYALRVLLPHDAHFDRYGVR